MARADVEMFWKRPDASARAGGAVVVVQAPGLPVVQAIAYQAVRGLHLCTHTRSVPVPQHHSMRGA